MGEETACPNEGPRLTKRRNFTRKCARASQPAVQWGKVRPLINSVQDAPEVINAAFVDPVSLFEGPTRAKYELLVSVTMRGRFRFCC